MPTAVAWALGLLLVLGFAQTGLAQNGTNPLTLTNNYFVTGDYVVAGWQKDLTTPIQTINGVPYVTGRIRIPDTVQAIATGVPSPSVPPGADIVAAFLYWETVEDTSQFPPHPGRIGFLNGYAITGSFLPTATSGAPSSWSSGGCSGSGNGSKIIQAYKADVRPFLPLDANGKIQGNGAFQIKLSDAGSNGNTVPFTLGATLVIIYRVESPSALLNSIVLYEGTFAPNNTSPTMSQTIKGFYRPAASPSAKITHIVGAGQPGKLEQVSFNNQPLLSPYGTLPPFPGIYNGSWDNPTWNVTADVLPQDSEMTSVVPTGTNNTNNTNGKCVDWGTVIFSTTVDDTDGDGLLDVWEDNKGYVDAISGQWVALPGADKSVKDMFVEIDYLSNLDGSAGPYKHSHLPKQAALDMVGKAFAARNINVHFDLGPGIYQSDGYVIPYPVSTPPGVPTFPGAGGNSISEGATIGNVPLFLCTDGATPCAFPGVPAVGWKGGYLVIKNTAPNPNSTPSIPLLGNFQPGRKDSYHYVLFGHALGFSRTYWSAAGEAPSLTGSGIATLVSIVVTNDVGIVTLTTPPLFLKPGDVACSDANCDRVTVEGALQPGNAALNGVYKFLSSPSSAFNNLTNMFTTTFTIQTAGVANGTYDFFSEPHLGLQYGGPTSTSGYSDLGGGDSAVTFGLWPADDAAGCQADPSIALQSGQTYCVNQVGTITAQGGTLLHELGHTNFLTHGGTFFPNEAGVVTSGASAGQYLNSSPVVPSYGLNCNPGFLSSMNYLFQIRGFPDLLPDGSHPIGYSGQTLPDLSETLLNEALGIGFDRFTGLQAAHFTRWYAPPNSLDNTLQSTVGGRFATLHCDGTPIGLNEPPAVRVEGSTLTEPSGFSGPVDWNNDLIVPDLTEPVAWQDVNFNGSTMGTPDPPFPGFNDWVNLDLRQIGARWNVFGFSGGGITGASGGITGASGGITGASGGTEQDSDTFNSSVDSPTLQTAVEPPGAHFVNLTWSAPGSGQQIRTYFIWRANTTNGPISATNQPTTIGKVTGTPPATTFTDPNVKNGQTYTYFVTAALGQNIGLNSGNQSGPSNMKTITISFNTGATGQ